MKKEEMNPYSLSISEIHDMFRGTKTDDDKRKVLSDNGFMPYVHDYDGGWYNPSRNEKISYWTDYFHGDGNNIPPFTKEQEDKYFDGQPKITFGNLKEVDKNIRLRMEQLYGDARVAKRKVLENTANWLQGLVDKQK